MAAPLSMHKLLLLFLAWTRTWTRARASCPQDEGLRQLCYCESGTNGILLDCSSGNFETVRAQLQENRPRLGLIQELQLQNVSIRSLPPGAFEGLFVKKLDLSFNSISAIDPNAFSGLENVLQILTLHKNELDKVPTEAIGRLANLLQLDLSKNKIGDLPRNILKGIPKIYDINLSTNRICRIDKDAFEPVRLSLQSLNLGENCMARVPAPAIRGFQNLLALHLHGNQFRQLDALQFMNLPNLNLINLSQNQVEKIHSQAFLNVPNLKYLYLADNNLRQVNEAQFAPFQKLELLDLSRNDIQIVPSGAFGSMPRLSQLYLAENKIFDIQQNAFLNSSLVILLLSGNRLAGLNSKMFNGMNYLQQLSLKNNQIADIPQNTFYQLPSLVVLDLSGNQLTHLPTATFLAQLSLFLLDLSRNRLTAIPYSALNQRIVTVILQENPLVCSERIHVIQNGVGVYVPDSVDQVCGGKPGVTNGPTDNSLSGGGISIPNLPGLQTGPGGIQPIQGLGQPQFPNTGGGGSFLQGGGRGGGTRFGPGQASFQGTGQSGQSGGTGSQTFNIGPGSGGNPFPLANRAGVTPTQPPGISPPLPSVGQPFIKPHPLDGGASLRTGGRGGGGDAGGGLGVPPTPTITRGGFVLGGQQTQAPALPSGNQFTGGRIPIDNLGHSSQLQPAINRLGGGGGAANGQQQPGGGANFWNNANQNRPPQLPNAWANLPQQPSFGTGGGLFGGPQTKLPPPGGQNAQGAANGQIPGNGGNTFQVATGPVDVLQNRSNVSPNSGGFTPGRTNPWRPGVGTNGGGTDTNPVSGIDNRLNGGNQGPGSVFRPPRPGPSPPYPDPRFTSSNFNNGPGVTATLPAGIIVGNNRPELGPDDSTALTFTFAPTYPPNGGGPRTFPPKPVKPNAGARGQDGVNPSGAPPSTKNRKPTMAASTIIAVALTVVVVVLVVVFVTLCIVRYRARQASRMGSESSTATRTSAYVAAQAARLNYGVTNTGGGGTGATGGTGAITGGTKTGTLTSSAFGGADYIRATQPVPSSKSTNNGTNNHHSSSQQQHNAWLYTTGTYSAASHAPY